MKLIDYLQNSVSARARACDCTLTGNGSHLRKFCLLFLVVIYQYKFCIGVIQVIVPLSSGRRNYKILES